MISIIIPTYNGAKFLLRYSLASLAKQDYQDWEALVIDDYSSDSSLEVAKSFASQNSRIRVIAKESNTGLAASLNIGLRESKGDIIAILEHDDIWLPNKLTKQKEVLKKHRISICRAAVYDEKKGGLTKINGGNLSCLAFNKDISDIIFPIPEEDKRYLGIEDGIITARLEIALAQGKIQPEDINSHQEVLTIMNVGSRTLSGQKNHQEMLRRYGNIINLYMSEKGKYPRLDRLIHFWRKHYLYNKKIAHLPEPARKIAYRLADYLKDIKNKKAVNILKKTGEYSRLIHYRQTFN